MPVVTDGPAGAPRRLLEAGGIAKSFGGARALVDASLTIEAGEVHGLVGANGAGKSTLIKVLAGLVRPDAGEVRIDGEPVRLDHPNRAAKLGLGFIHQELALVPDMTVMENVMLGAPKPARFGIVDWRAVERTVAPLAHRVGLTVPLRSDVRRLSTADQWLVSICRALVRDARLIVMDEPTASLSAAEAEKLFGIVRSLAASGVAVLYVSHRLDEIMSLCRRVTTFRDGRSVAVLEGRALTKPALIEAIVGHAVTEVARPPTRAKRGEVVLSAAGLERLPRVRSASFALHRGEVLGLGGLVGAGRSELARLVFGADRARAGRMLLGGRPFAPRSPADAVRAGIGFVPEERRAEGLVLGKSVAFNLGLGDLAGLVRGPALPLVDLKRQRRRAADTAERLSVKMQGPNQPVGRLSGGNQQKVLIGRWLQKRRDVLILDEPTRGVDIGARGEIHRLVRGLAAEGLAVLVISSEPDELPELCDRVLVMNEGTIIAELEGEAISRAAIIAASYRTGEAAPEARGEAA
ncbi:sugar ABC transporter ATP-binding protein [Aureimonas leprariae]|uniref:Sugar ABC transporter ATP-binding protein n=1 Tax=Plantimonas leprariae TaxID=2615207 RepID=A0A7V7PML8_9HYPH|nr:sugar ABC transporter ATP-binding protein [Aureimonas leprariae]KAB0678515.1 sugar ABC transporter ATP-binding protein [Aureimonas leprariae]